jgi:hypothetical protein
MKDRLAAKPPPAEEALKILPASWFINNHAVNVKPFK